MGLELNLLSNLTTLSKTRIQQASVLLINSPYLFEFFWNKAKNVHYVLEKYHP